MANPRPYTTKKETAFAQAVLRYLGVRDTHLNPGLVAVIVAWMRASGNTSKVSGWNYLGMDKSKYAYKTKITNTKYVQTFGRVVKVNTTFAFFKTMDIAAKASAAYIKADSRFNLFVNIVRRKAVGSKAQGKQVGEMLQELSYVGWDKKPASYWRKVEKEINAIKNVQWPDIKIVQPPKQKPITTKTPVPPPPRVEERPPRGLRDNYLDGWRANQFLHGRTHVYSYSMSGLDMETMVK